MSRPAIATGLVLSALVMAGAGPAEATGIINIPDDAPVAVIVVSIALFTLVSEDLTVIATGMLIASGEFPLSVGLMGCFLGIAVGDFGLWALGRFAGRRVLRWPFISRAIDQKSLDRWGRTLDTHMGKAIILSRVLPGTRLPTYLAAGILGKHTQKFVLWMLLAVGVWTPALLMLSVFIGRPLLGFFEGILHGPYALVASLFILYVLVRLLGYESTDLGRQRLKADLKKIVAHEFWPFWFFYLPLVPWLLFMALRYKPMTLTCVNPGIRRGGGIVGESKSAILECIEHDEHVAPFTLIEHTHEEGASDRRAGVALERLRTDDRFGGFPVVLKPDASEKGASVRVARSEEDIERYFEGVEGDVQMQAFREGPVEVGVLWSRTIEGDRETPLDDRPGEIFSITRKTFPAVTGDGERTLEELIWHHPRYRCQADVFTMRFSDRLDGVVPDGERFSLGIAGNHAMGAKFTDGKDLLTPELAREFERLAQSFRNPHTGGRLDFGRFDVRAASEDDLRAGRNFSIIELNGATSESTEMYDPNHSLFWCYRVLYRQWLRVFQLGAARRREGASPMTFGGLCRLITEHFKRKKGFGVSD